MHNETVATKRVFSGQNLFLLISLALGHTLMHCFQQGWYIILPSVKETFVLSDVQYGGIESIRSASGTAVQIPSGAVSDMLRKQWAIIVISALLGVGIAYVILGLAPNYGTVLLAAILVGISIALWHPPALSVLSARLAERRGLAISIHGMGGNLGNAIGPVMIGAVIGAMAWKMAAWVMAIPMIVLSLLLWVVLRNVPGREGGSITGRNYSSALLGLFKNSVILGLIISGGIRAMGTISIFAFFSLYCRVDLGFGPAKTGFYFTTMMVSGIFSQPLLGYLSDRFGRKIVLIPSMILLGFLEIILVWSGSGIGLILVAICIGLFIYTLGAVIQAAAMDASPEETGATTIALLFGSSALFTIPSPVIAGWLSETYGTPSVFLYSGGLVLLSAIIMMFLPIDRKKTAQYTEYS
ncbi:MFS transporter [Thermodesulfobacteriota bacterium]